MHAQECRITATNLPLHPVPVVRLQTATRGVSRKAEDTQSPTVAKTCVFAGFMQMQELRPEPQKMHSKQQVFSSY